MRELMGQPERNELRVETEALSLLICDAGEVLEAHERNPSSADYELAGVRGTDADHQHHVDIDVRGQQDGAALLSIARKGKNVDAVQHSSQIAVIGVYRGVYNILKMWPVGIDDVVIPVSFEQATVRGEVAFVGGGSVGAFENGKEIRYEVDQHLDQGAGRRRGGTMDAEMIVVARWWNKSDGPSVSCDCEARQRAPRCCLARQKRVRCEVSGRHDR